MDIYHRRTGIFPKLPIWYSQKQKVACTMTKRHIRIRNMQHLKEFLCVVPATLLIIILNYYPLVELIRISFTDWNMLKKDYSYVGFKNWIWLFQTANDNRFLQSFRITMLYSLLALLVSLVGGLLLALLFNRMSKLFSFLRTIVIIPKYISMSTSAMTFLFLLNENYGLFNKMIVSLGGDSVKWLTDSTTALVSIVMLTGWHGIGYAMMIYLGAFQGVEQSYYESAKIDGANAWQQFWKVSFPLIAPTTLFLFVTQFISAMKVFQAVDVLTAGGPHYSTEVIVYQIYSLAFKDYRIDRASVVSTVFFVFVMLMTAIAMKISNKYVNYDS